ncbi:hypothetical protein SRABI76_02447 [Microbacterium oxydans]|uniref:Uncharacterized protein n=1 Tax=Microbacterium oxydans TaxID=82380 RepID=A0A0F0LB20_9MICO|nr:DUF6157 family protein [Microbacterium oxydans]KJL29864.1 hypothetical protein RS83_01435 [Microbacterium oxydans]CAH0218507.1 hypothetical protein SRABI76_02447 [Microbacterium oxydans]
MTAHTTNYVDTFIEVAEDCPADDAVEPPLTDEPTIAALHYRLIAEHPYARTSDEVVFETYALRHGIAVDDEAARAAFFSKGQPCLRSSPLGKRYGWGLHHDADGRVALVPRGSTEYAALAADPQLTHTRAMRSRRA